MICEERLLYSNFLAVCCRGRETTGFWLGSWTSARKLLLPQQAQRLVPVRTGITVLTEQEVSAAKESGCEPRNLSALLFLDTCAVTRGSL